MTKEELAKDIRFCVPAECTAKDRLRVVNAVFDSIKKAVANGDPVTIRGFGTFKSIHKASRIAQDINKKEPVVIEAHYEPVFKPSAEFKTTVKETLKE